MSISSASSHHRKARKGTLTNDTYRRARARLVARLTQAGLSTALAEAELDALLAAAHEPKTSVASGMRPQDVPHDLVMAGIRAAGTMSGDGVRGFRPQYCSWFRPSAHRTRASTAVDRRRRVPSGSSPWDDPQTCGRGPRAASSALDRHPNRRAWTSSPPRSPSAGGHYPFVVTVVRAGPLLLEGTSTRMYAQSPGPT